MERWSRDKIVRRLKEEAERLGHSPTGREVPKKLYVAARRCFRSWNEAKEEAGLEVSPVGRKLAQDDERKWTREKVAERLREEAERLGHSPMMKEVPGNLEGAAKDIFGSWNEAKEEAGLPLYKGGGEKWSGEKVKARIREIAEELGRPPTRSEVPRKLYSAAWRYFDSWSAAKEEAGAK